MRKKVMKQMHRQSRIRKNSLIIGIDVGKDAHSAALCSSKGQLLCLLKKVLNSRKGFNFLLRNIKETAKKHNLAHIIVGAEPTGPYWQPIMYFLGRCGFDLVFIRPGAVKEFNKLADSSNSKSDQQDALKIASLIKHGHFLDGPVITESLYKELRLLSSQRACIQKELNSSLNKLGSRLQVHFPELGELFSSLGRKSVLALLERFPLPQDVVAAGQKKISSLIKRASHNNLGEKRAEAIYRAAQSSIGIREGLIAARLTINRMVKTIRLQQEQKALFEVELIRLAKTTKYYDALVSLPGVGPLSAALFLGALGEPGRFNDAREIVSYAGMDPVQRQSGLKVSPSFSSKQGRHDLRHILYLMTLRCIKLYEPLRSFYERKSLSMPATTKKKALCAASNKLVHMLFARTRDGSYQSKFDENKIRYAA